MKPAKWQLIITCEHAGNFIPAAFQQYIDENDPILHTHRGIDIGALDMSIQMSSFFVCPFYFQKISRLLIDCNRSIENDTLFSEWSKELPAYLKSQLLDEYHVYRDAVEEKIAGWIHNGDEVLHLSIHTFTQNFNGHLRDGDMGVLFDPKHFNESDFANLWMDTLSNQFPDFTIRPNYPYLGTDDGFTTYLREKHKAQYIGIELEVCQKWTLTSKWPGIITGVNEALKRVLDLKSNN